MGNIKFLILLILPIFSQGNRCGSTGNWTQYKDEKCYFFIDNFTTAEIALTWCISQDPSASLAVIKSPEEQQFINDYLYVEHGVLDGVWLGATRVNSTQEFHWANGDDFSSFSNWVPGYPSDDTTRDCSRMTSSTGKSIKAENGEWTDVDCESRNLVLCSKPCDYSHEELVAELLRLRLNFQESESEQNALQMEVKTQKKELENTKGMLCDTRTKLDNATTRLGQMEIDLENIIPVGFLYFQVGSQPSPMELWPRYSWEDVSGEYSGLFFRVAGGGAADLGTVQEENSPRIGGVRHTSQTGAFPTSIYVPSSGWSQYIHAGVFGNGSINTREGLSFSLTNTGEVRPKNTAMSVWKRI